MLTLYGLKNCDTCKKALAALKKDGREVAFVDIRAEADLAATLPKWLGALGAAALINKRSTTWRGLSAQEQAASEDDAAARLEAHPTLIKRPVIETGDRTLVGWGKDSISALD